MEIGTNKKIPADMEKFSLQGEEKKAASPKCYQ